MKNILLTLTIFLFAQMADAQHSNTSYEELWKQVQQFENEALTKSAWKVVETISEKANKEKNSPQIVKSLLYSSKYAMILEEDAQLMIINAFKSEIAKADFATKNVLNGYLANMYWHYFQNHRYQFYNRTKTEVKVDTTDFRTWDLTTLFHEIDYHFERSLENENRLKEVLVSEFDEILNQQEGSENLRPTLFDLLAHNALAFYTTSETTITRPADKFEIDDPELLCEAYPFTQLKIDTSDQTSMQAKALRIFQKLVLHHLPSSRPYALVEVDVERLRFTYQHATFENKDQRYLEVLQNMAASSKGGLAASLYTYEIAALYQQWGQTYQPNGDTTHRWKLSEALELCESVIAINPKSRGAEKCKALKSQILGQSLQMMNERHIPVNQASRILVTYKNHKALELSARKITQHQLEQLDKIGEHPKKLAFLKKLSVVKEWNATLRNENDYQNHSTEILLPPLPNGHFVILATPEGNQNGTFAFSPVQVTDFALVETRTPTHHLFQVIDRNNGKPISSARVTFNYQIRYDGPRKKKTGMTDKMGMVSIALTKEYWNNVSILIEGENESAFYKDFYINERHDPAVPVADFTAFLFTDRSIYRPGQPVYFKGVAVMRHQGTSTILENHEVKVVLKDVNYQEVASQKFKTNEYGSFSGEFILPSGGLTGNYTLEVDSKKVALHGSTSFSVEEYKRPKFETYFQPISETFKVNDSITVNGVASAYAGSNITDAKVSYTVRRVVYYPRWYYWSRPYFNSTPQEIAHGETKTDAAGKYEIHFKAIPDTNSDKKDLPTFSYEVTADVTDINGETHSTTTTVRVGYHALTASVNIADPLNKDQKEAKISIFTNNLNGEFVAAKGTLKMYKLTPPEYVLRSRPWTAPDYEGFTKNEFKNLYPHDAFENEHDYTHWEKGVRVWQSDFDTGKSKEVSLRAIKKWQTGTYVIELETKDKFGQEVKDIAHTTLFSLTDKKLADNQLFQIKTDKNDYKIGDKATITLLSNVKDLDVTVFIEKDRQLIDTRLVHLNVNAQSFTVPVTENDLGGFSISYSFSAYNSYQSGSTVIAVPYPQDALEIETLTFRDKLKPGTDETWAFKVKGPKGEKVAAELLAGMYDASLDAFRGHYWGFNPIYRPSYYASIYTNAHQSFGTSSFNIYHDSNDYYSYTSQQFDTFNWFGFYFGYGRYYGNELRRMKKTDAFARGIMADDAQLEEVVTVNEMAPATLGSVDLEKSESKNPQSIGQQSGGERDGTQDKGDSLEEVQLRKNLQETAFFFPQLQTDKDGNVSFNFTTPEALTKWNLQLLAHTKDLKSAYTTRHTVTQKELMVIPNVPRFLREGDEIVISTKIANLTEKSLSGLARLELVDAVTGELITEKLMTSSAFGTSPQGAGEIDGRLFKVVSLGNTQVSWRLKIPKNIQAVQYKVIAKAGDFSDGEQNVLPVLTNRILVTETLPMWVKSNESKTFTLDKLANVTSTTLKHHKLTLEMTSNPAWYAVQALPYLMEYPYECNEQMFSRYYANSLASHIANSNVRIKEVFDQWRNSDALLSNLEKNQELKSLLIQETPWLRDTQTETEQKKRIALLFDLVKMKHEQINALNKLKNNQKSSGAWAWFKGGPDNRFITQHIITGLGHLKKLKVSQSAGDVQQMIQKAIGYLDHEFVDEYERMKRHAPNIDDDQLSQTQIHYMYMRSFFTDVAANKNVREITAYYHRQARAYWINKGLYSKGMLALVLHRTGDSATSNNILRSLMENSITSDELGMYWKENANSWYWYSAPIETQALMIEAFGEIQNDIETNDNLKIWLLKNKQTNQWKTTKATTEAVYALLLQGSEWLSVTEAVDVLVGGHRIAPSKLENVKVEAGTGYYKTSWDGSEVEPSMANVQISKKGKGIAWGAMYWQYFEDLDKIRSAETPLKLKKKLFLRLHTDTGEELSEITEKSALNVGDLVRVRIELRADRDMEFVHMKDMRAAGMEPISVFSQYKWQDGLGYYESTKDASTNFFFDYLRKGVYVFEYDLRVNNAGEFSNGITTIQSMYAPEFSSHSEGVRMLVNGQ